MNPYLSIVIAMALVAALLVRLAPPTRALARAACAGWAGFATIALLAAAASGAWIAVEPLALIALLLTGFVGAIILSFARRYLRADRDPRGFGVTVLLLLAAVMLFMVADAFWLIAFGWIASGWLMAALIGHVADWPDARAARRRTLATFALGDGALLAGFALIAATTGIGSVSALRVVPGVGADIAALLLVLAASVRCALPPFQRWLGRSMTAPTPASALMHAGFVNAGGLLLIRFAPVLEAAPVARVAAIAAGLAAALIGGAVMLVRPDIKRGLAGSTSAQMGFMLMTCGLGAYAAALWHIVAHGLFKAWLFLRSGSTIGLLERPVAIRLAPALVALIGGGAVTASVTIGWAGALSAATVPLILAATMVAAALVHVLRHAALALGAGLVAASYAAGLALFDRLLGAHAPPMGGTALAAAIVAIFMTAWLLQTLALARRLSLPPALYARLLNA